MYRGGYNEDYICIYRNIESMGSQYPERHGVHFYLAIDAP